MSNPSFPPSGPAHSWPPPYPYAPPPAERNGFALASLLVGLLCFPPLGIVFGIVALVRIARRRQQGRALAVVGLAVSVAMTGVMVYLAGSRLAERGYAAVDGEPTAMGELHSGDCFNVRGGDLRARHPVVYRVDCGEPHHAEVVATDVDADSEGAASGACWKAQDAYAMDTWALPDEAESYYFERPRRGARYDDARQVLCVIGTVGEEQRGSLRRDRTSLTPEQSAFLDASNALDRILGDEPDDDVQYSLERRQAWAREVYGALGDEVKVLEQVRDRPGLDQAARAQLKELGAAREAWQRASQARTQGEFERGRQRALGAMSVETEKALRGAYGLSTRVPQWLSQDPGESHEGPAREIV